MLEWAETYSNQTGGFYDVIGEFTAENVEFVSHLILCFQAGTLEVDGLQSDPNSIEGSTKTSY